MKYKGFRYALISTARNILNRDFLSSYQKLNKFPVMLIWGTQDKTILKTEIDTLQQLMHPEFIPVDNSGHLPQFEHATFVNRQIIEFLKRNKIRKIHKNICAFFCVIPIILKGYLPWYSPQLYVLKSGLYFMIYQEWAFRYIDHAFLK
jgi:hypothetical protein